MKTMSKLLFSFVLLGLLAGCHTVQGAGQDLKVGGQAIQNAATPPSQNQTNQSSYNPNRQNQYH